MSDLFLKIGIGGLINLEMITFDFLSGDKLRPYMSKILARDFQYGFKREFVEKKYHADRRIFYGNQQMQMISFNLEKHFAYEYKRFAGNTFGEIEEGYLVVLPDKILQIEYDELLHWCGTAKEKEARAKRYNIKKQEVRNEGDNFAKDDVDF